MLPPKSFISCCFHLQLGCDIIKQSKGGGLSMALIKPFRALRPNPAYADQIADLPYDVMSSAEARVMVKDKPYSFLRIDRAEINFPEPVDPHHPQVYAKAGSILRQMIT